MKLDIKKTGLYISLITAGILIGYISTSNNRHISTSEEEHQHPESTYICSMHPQVRQNEPGQCPICGMDLVVVDEGGANENPMEIRMSPAAMQLANVQTSIITQQKATKEIRLNGKVQVNEQYVTTQTSHISGRIEKLLINYTGESVTKGQIIALVYSPALVTAQRELFEAYKIRASQPTLFDAAKEKLKNWKLTNRQIDGIIKSGMPIEKFPILSDMNGVVISKRVNLGDYVMQGSMLFEVTNLSKIWVLFDVYESDIVWVKKGDEMDFTIQSLPSQKFTGKISFIDPVIDPKTRVAKARIVLNNPGQQLKPGMFASGVLKSSLKNGEPAIVVPKSAVMWTGERSLVYVKTSSDVGVNFMMRAVTLGADLGDRYVITKGLNEGEEIATNGTFSIDAAAQLAGKPSMMNPLTSEGKTFMRPHHGNMNQTSTTSEEMPLSIGAPFKKQLTEIYKAYLLMQQGFISTDSKVISSSIAKVEASIEHVGIILDKGEIYNRWTASLASLNQPLRQIKASGDIEPQRLAFADFSEALYSTIKTFGNSGEPIYYQFCPMARNDKGAYWLSSIQEIKNPYFGDSMLTCGETKEIIN